ncbi:MAG: 4Fe-4S cluster-binding domain-containing protein, partial [Waterburya sp.]
APALANLARQVKARGLNVMSFTGFTLEKLQSEYAPAGTQDLLAQLDILIDGAYIQSLAINSPDSPVSSSNQRVHVFNPELEDKITWASDQTEIHVLKDGSRIVTGYLGQMSLSD